MSEAADDPRCPECGGPIGQRATYCMHCSADLTDERDAADADGDGVWDQAGATATTPREPGVGRSGTSAGSGGTDGVGRSIARLLAGSSATDAGAGQLLTPDGLVDDTLTVVVGIVGGIVVGAVGTAVLAAVTGSGWGVAFGLAAWLAATAYLVRRRTVQGAIAKTGYAVAVVLLSVPVIAVSPVVDVEGGLAERGGLFVVLLLFVAVPAAIAAAVGWVASRFVPEGAGGSEG